MNRPLVIGGDLPDDDFTVTWEVFSASDMIVPDGTEKC